jgi:hypothetical protein
VPRGVGRFNDPGRVDGNHGKDWGTDGEYVVGAFTEVRLYRDGVQIARQAVSGSGFASQLEDAHADAADARYYYAIVRQADDNDRDGRGDEAIASPIGFAE